MRPDHAPKPHQRLRLLAVLERLPPHHRDHWRDAFLLRYQQFIDFADAEEWAERSASLLEGYLAGDQELDELLTFE